MRYIHTVTVPASDMRPTAAGFFGLRPRKRQALRYDRATRRPGRPRTAPRTKVLGFFRLRRRKRSMGDFGKRPTGAINNQVARKRGTGAARSPSAAPAQALDGRLR